MTCNDEVIITDDGEIVDINKCNSNNLYAQVANIDYIEGDEICNVECEVICSSADSDKIEIHTNNIQNIVSRRNTFYTERVNIMLKVKFCFFY